MHRAMASVTVTTFEISQGPFARRPPCCARQEIVAEMIQVTVELEIFLSRGACAKIGKAINCILGKHNVEEVAEIIPSP